MLVSVSVLVLVLVLVPVLVIALLLILVLDFVIALVQHNHTIRFISKAICRYFTFNSRHQGVFAYRITPFLAPVLPPILLPTFLHT